MFTKIDDLRIIGSMHQPGETFLKKMLLHILVLLKHIQMQDAQKAGHETHNLKITSIHALLLSKENAAAVKLELQLCNKLEFVS